MGRARAAKAETKANNANPKSGPAEAYRTIREAVRLEPENKSAREIRFQIEQEFPELVKDAGAADAG